MPAFWIWRCSDSGFQVVKLAIAAGFSLFMPCCVQRFVISGGKLGNRCRDCPGLALLLAVIPDFRGQTWQSLQGMPGIGPLACSDSRFQGVNLGITAGIARDWPSGVHRFLISGLNLRFTVAPSLLHRRMARLRNVVADAGRDRSPRRRHNPK